MEDLRQQTAPIFREAKAGQLERLVYILNVMQKNR
jgi:hypothetical protein